MTASTPAAAPADLHCGHATWGFDTPSGAKIRYTVKLTEKGEWNEIGELSRDGKEWRKFFDMTLTKKK